MRYLRIINWEQVRGEYYIIYINAIWKRNFYTNIIQFDGRSIGTRLFELPGVLMSMMNSFFWNRNPFSGREFNLEFYMQFLSYDKQKRLRWNWYGWRTGMICITIPLWLLYRPCCELVSKWAKFLFIEFVGFCKFKISTKNN